MCVNRGISFKNNTATMTAINEAEACTGWLHEKFYLKRRLKLLGESSEGKVFIVGWWPNFRLQGKPNSPHLHALSKTLCCGVAFGSNSLIAPYGWNAVRLTLNSTRNFILLKSTIGWILHWELVIKAATSSKWL